MLVLLHEKINAITPISGVSNNGDGTYTVSYITEPSEPQLLLINKAIEGFPLEIAKAQKLEQIGSEWSAFEKAGWDSGLGYSLGITPADVALLVGVFALAKEAAALGLPIPSVISTTNTVISFTSIAEMTMLLLQYGQARSTMATVYAARRKAVEVALTVEELVGV